MSNTSFRTTRLQNCLVRMRAGDRSARDELLRGVGSRVEELAHKMLRRFPNVGRWVEADDVLQNALLRLLSGLERLEPASLREFLGLAAVMIRRELLDLARHFHGPLGIGAHHASNGNLRDGRAPAFDPSHHNEAASELEHWTVFHEAVEKLPADEREVVSLIFYHGWTQAEVAELFQVDERTIRRRWRAACLRLHPALGDSCLVAE